VSYGKIIPCEKRGDERERESGKKVGR